MIFSLRRCLASSASDIDYNLNSPSKITTDGHPSQIKIDPRSLNKPHQDHAWSPHLLKDRQNFIILSMQNTHQNYLLEETSQWLPALKSNGFVVLRDVLNNQEITHATDLFWEWLQALGSGIKRDDVSTWNDNNWPGSGSIGFFVSYGGCHTKASWYLRTHPRVKQAFGEIWETKSLISSFDTFICWRPWWNKFGGNWHPYVENLHIDQNPVNKRGFHCVQGMIPLVDVRLDGVGGLMVVPNTNNDATQDDIAKRYPHVARSKSDWVEFHGNDPYIGKGELIECKAGSLILFDSRTIHGGKICEPSQDFKELYENKLARLAMTVTMVPKDLQNAAIRQRRLNAFKARVGLTHWPQEYNTTSFGVMIPNIKRDLIKYDWPTLTPEIDDLI